MITNCKDITSENPIKEIWKLLRFFQDIELTSKYHCRIHNIPEKEISKDKNLRTNVHKQAKQIGYCIRQAEEYFKASSQVGLATRPNLLYYGTVSLSRALILLKKDGTYSVEYSRRVVDIEKEIIVQWTN